MKIRYISNLREISIVILIYFLLTIGQATYSIKFSVPWFGTNDFSSYYLMAQNPFNNLAENPWHSSRILTPFLAWLIFKLNIFLRTDNSPFMESYSSYQGNIYDERILFSLITVNYIALLLSSLVLMHLLKVTLNNNFSNKIIIYSVPLLIFLSPATNFSILTGVTEGTSILFISLLLLTIKQKNYKTYILLIFLSVLQRELIPLFIFFVVYNLRKDGYGVKWYFPAIFAFLISILNIFFRDLSTAASSLRFDIGNSLSDISFYNLAVSGLYLNLFIIYLLSLLFFPKTLKEIKQFMPVLLFLGSLLVLFFMHPAGIQNLMRMLSLSNPLIILLLVSRLVNIRSIGSSKNILTDRELTVIK